MASEKRPWICIAAEWAPYDIRVNALAPGFFASEMTDQYPPGYLDSQAPRIPSGRRGDPAELAATVVFLASDAASWITGETYVIDGGAGVRGVA